MKNGKAAFPRPDVWDNKTLLSDGEYGLSKIAYVATELAKGMVSSKYYREGEIPKAAVSLATTILGLTGDL